MGIIFVSTGILHNRLPMMRNSQIVHVPAGYLVLLVAVPFAIVSAIYAGLEFGMARVFQESATRLHFVCTLFGTLETIRVYWSWAVTSANMHPDQLTSSSFGGAYAFLILAGAAFAWNLWTSGPKPKLRR